MGSLHICLPPTPTAARLSRRAITEWLVAQGVNDETIGDAAVVVSELVTNGVIHAPGGDIELTASKDRNGVSIDVTTCLLPVGSLIKPRIDGDEHGRGLAIVEAIVTNMVITEDQTLHRVSCLLLDDG